MKNLYFSLLAFIIYAFASAQIVNFSDANFYDILLQANSSNQIASTEMPVYNSINNSWSVSNFHAVDSDSDGSIELSEIQAIKWLDISYSTITNISEIENFNNLVYLSVQGNQINTLNVSNLFPLESLNCSYNELISLNIANLSNLKYLDCGNNQLQNINVSSLINLKYLNCYLNQLSDLNTTGLNNLEGISCFNNQITTLNISDLGNLYFLSCEFNQLTTIDVLNLSNLEYLSCSNNPQLLNIFMKNTIVDNPNDFYFSNNPNLQYICSDQADISFIQQKINNYGYTNCNVDSNCLLNYYQFDISNDFTLSPIPAKDILTISNKQNATISSISIYNILGQVVLTSTNPSETIDVSSLKTGNYFMKINSDKGISSSKFIKE